MSDPELVLKKLALIESCVRELRELGRPDRMTSDLRERRFLEHTLQIAVQATIDAASRVISDQRLGEPSTQREVFDLLERAGWLERGSADSLRKMTGFRNVLVHGYDKIDLEVVRDILDHRLDDLLSFASTIRRKIQAEAR